MADPKKRKSQREMDDALDAALAAELPPPEPSTDPDYDELPGYGPDGPPPPEMEFEPEPEPRVTPGSGKAPPYHPTSPTPVPAAYKKWPDDPWLPSADSIPPPALPMAPLPPAPDFSQPPPAAPPPTPPPPSPQALPVKASEPAPGPQPPAAPLAPLLAKEPDPEAAAPPPLPPPPPAAPTSQPTAAPVAPPTTPPSVPQVPPSQLAFLQKDPQTQARNRVMSDHWANAEQDALIGATSEQKYGVGEAIRDTAPGVLGSLLDLKFNHGHGLGYIAAETGKQALGHQARGVEKRENDRKFALGALAQRTKTDASGLSAARIMQHAEDQQRLIDRESRATDPHAPGTDAFRELIYARKGAARGELDQMGLAQMQHAFPAFTAGFAHGGATNSIEDAGKKAYRETEQRKIAELDLAGRTREAEALRVAAAERARVDAKSEAESQNAPRDAETEATKRTATERAAEEVTGARQLALDKFNADQTHKFKDDSRKALGIAHLMRDIDEHGDAVPTNFLAERLRNSGLPGKALAGWWLSAKQNRTIANKGLMFEVWKRDATGSAATQSEDTAFADHLGMSPLMSDSEISERYDRFRDYIKTKLRSEAVGNKQARMVIDVNVGPDWMDWEGNGKIQAPPPGMRLKRTPLTTPQSSAPAPAADAATRPYMMTFKGETRRVDLTDDAAKNVTDMGGQLRAVPR